MEDKCKSLLALLRSTCVYNDMIFFVLRKHSIISPGVVRCVLPKKAEPAQIIMYALNVLNASDIILHNHFGEFIIILCGFHFLGHSV